MSEQQKPPSLSNAQMFVVGGATAIVSKTTQAPLERLKLLLQNQNEIRILGRLDKPYKGAVDCTVRIYRTEGVLAFWRGLLPTLIGYFPTAALQFALKDSFRQFFKSSKGDNYKITLLKNVSAGVAAGATGLISVYHLDYCRVRLANDVKFGKHGERQFSGMIDVYKKTFSSDGIVGLYRGFVISCVGIIVYRGLYFGLYDTLKPKLLKKDSGVWTSMALGYGVTITSGLVSYPLDTIRCRMLMRSIEPIKYRGSIDCLTQILKTEGVLSLWRGAGVSIVRGIVGALLLPGYDMLKTIYVK